MIFYRKYILILLFCYTTPAFSQVKKIVIVNYKNYLAEIQSDSNNQLIDIKKLIPSIQVDLRYATNSNFTKQTLYPPQAKAYVRLPVAKALAIVQQQLKQYGLGLKIYDAYRPYAVSKKIWSLVHDERYAADPTKGSGHNRGIAVDITLVNINTGAELPMPTAFDNFSDTAHCTFMQLSKPILANRKLLHTIMEQNGFKGLDTEWWHYAFIASVPFSVLDISLKQISNTLCIKRKM